MPIYEFKCTNTSCNNVEEHLLRHSDPLPAACEKCASPLEKLVSQTSFALKGSGWYVTDYKGGNPGAASTTAAAPAAASDANSESKPASSSAIPDAGSCAAPACATTGCAAN
ncbi:zinc ribbon domain-containing protein [bacterium]|nr:zinc ribbon domain-containing protein [bacterium]